jgi:hypothetical protein
MSEALLFIYPVMVGFGFRKTRCKPFYTASTRVIKKNDDIVFSKFELL